MNKQSLKVNIRTILGKKVKQLRKNHKLPGNIYGKNTKSLAVEMDTTDFLKVYNLARETNVVDLKLKDEDIRPVLIHDLQLHPSTQMPLHVDFYQVNLKEKIKTKIPIVASGEPEAVVQKLGVLLTLLNEIEVEALPMDLPDKITVQVRLMKAVGDVLKVKDIPLSKNVTLLTDSNSEIFKIDELIVKEVEKEAPAETQELEGKPAEEKATTENMITEKTNPENKQTEKQGKSVKKKSEVK